MFTRVVLLILNLQNDGSRNKALKFVLHIPGVLLVTIDRMNHEMKVIGRVSGEYIMNRLRQEKYMALIRSSRPVENDVIERLAEKMMTMEDVPYPIPASLFSTILAKLVTSKSAKLLNRDKIKGSPKDEKCFQVRVVDKKNKKQTQKLIELLYKCGSNEISFVSIVAAAGMGKTTFAHLVYSDPVVSNTFEARVWVCCSWINDIEGLFRAVMESLTGVYCALADLNDLLELVKQKLVGKRLLLVLDNACKDDDQFIRDAFIRFSQLGFSTMGNIVLFTTRKMTESTSGLCRSFVLSPVTNDDWWMIAEHACAIDGNYTGFFLPFRKLWKRNTFSATFGHSVEVDKFVLATCIGSPLSARLLGGLVRFTTIDQLSAHMKNFIHQYKSENSLLPVLEVSFHLLPEHLRECLIFLSLFPKDHLFKKDHVIQLWISQGLIKPNHGEKEEEVGTKYFDELLLRNFIQSPLIENNQGSSYQMHNLVYDFVLSISGEEMLQLNGSTIFSFSGRLRHLSFSATGLDYAIDAESLKQCPNLYSLLVISGSCLDWSANRIHIQNPKSLNDLFQNLVHLKAIDLSFSDIKELPSTIQNLINLRYLCLNYTYIRNLPESLCSLLNLQFLGLHNCVDLTELPKDTKNLISLRNLDIWKDSEFISIPQGIGHLTDLEILTAFHIGEASIAELKNLVNLRGKLHIGGLNYVSNAKEAMEANLIDKTGLRNLIFQWSDIEWESDRDLEKRTASEMFENLQPCINLEELTVRGYPGVIFPNWLGIPLFSHLNSITLDNCYQSAVLPTLGQLPSLKYLFIRKIDQVQKVGREFCGPVKNAFPSLEMLKISELYQWEMWNGVEDGDFHHLQSLSISRCYKLNCLPCIRSVNQLSLHSCVELPRMPSLPSLKSLSIVNFQGLRTLSLTAELASLQTLEVKYCKHLLRLEGLSDMISLKELTLANCPELQLKPDEQLPPELEVVKIHRSCYLLKEWCPPEFFQESENDQVLQRTLIRDVFTGWISTSHPIEINWVKREILKLEKLARRQGEQVNSTD